MFPGAVHPSPWPEKAKRTPRFRAADSRDWTWGFARLKKPKSMGTKSSTMMGFNWIQWDSMVDDSIKPQLIQSIQLMGFNGVYLYHWIQWDIMGCCGILNHRHMSQACILKCVAGSKWLQDQSVMRTLIESHSFGVVLGFISLHGATA